MTQGMTISEQAKALAKKVLDQPATEHDIAVVERQLGRYPRGMVAVGARCVCGRPLAVVTRPLLPGGVPFPTTCYLTGPEAVKAISHIEAEGKMKEYNDLLAEDDDLKAPTSVRTNCIWRSGMKSPLLWKTAKSISKAPVPAACLFASSVCTPCWRKRW